jgi:transcription antitermination factor NusG
MSSLHAKVASTERVSERIVAEVQWYVAYTSAKHEKKVAAEIGRRSLECFLPLYESLRQWKDRRIKLDLPLFPGYIFVHFSLEQRLQVLQIPGVVRLVGFSGCAAPVPEIEIKRIRAILSHGLCIEPHPYLATGRRVRVKTGPLSGLEGTIVRRKNRNRFVVAVDLIRRAVALDVEEAELEAVSPTRLQKNAILDGSSGSSHELFN